MLLYKIVIRSKIDDDFIAKVSARYAALKLLHPSHNKVLQISLGACATSHEQSLYCESGEPSLSDRRTYLTLDNAMNVAANEQHPLYENTFSDRYYKPFTRKSNIYQIYQNLSISA